MKKIMILGAGPAQVPLIQAAKAMGLGTVVATIPGDYPGIPAADVVSYTDITDPPAIAAAAKQYAVSGVTSCCSEICLPAQAYTCDMLGLPGPSMAAAEISVNKLAMKKAFSAGSIRTPEYRVLRGLSDLDCAIAALGLPLVVKAVDLQGSNGVYVVRDAETARRAMQDALALSGQDFCLAEAFAAGENIGAEAFVQNGNILFVLPDGTLSFLSVGGANIPVGHFVPLDQNETLCYCIRAEVERAVGACGFDNCAVNVDLVLHNGEPCIIELTARAGATCLPELVSLYYGVDYYRMILMAALGQDVSGYFAARPSQPQAAAAAMLQAPRTGTVHSIRLPKPLPENVHQVRLLVREGDQVHAFSQTGDRIGQVIVSGDSPDDCRQRLDALLTQIEIEVQ